MGLLIDRNSPIPIYHQLKELILGLIESGELKVGDRLPSEVLIAAKYDINRLTVRRAIDELVRAGVLYRERGKGTFVARVVEDETPRPTTSEGEPLDAVGLVVPYMNTMFWLDVVRGVESAIGRGRYHLIFYRTDDDPDLEIRYLERLKADGVRGAVVFSSHRSKLTAELVLDMEHTGFPIVCVDRYPTGGNVDYVVSDNEGGAFTATEHLINLGHKRIGHIGYAAMKKLLALGERRPTAVFALTDYLAIGAMKAIRESGLAVPEDIAIVGFDNLDIAEFAEVPLTTVEQQVWEMGRRAGEMLIEKVESKPLAGRPSPRQVILPTRLIVRESCGMHKKAQANAMS